MTGHERLQALQYIRYVHGIIKENAVDSGSYRAKNQQAILEALSAVSPQVDALLMDTVADDRANQRDQAQDLQRILDAINASPTYTVEEEAYILDLQDRIGEARSRTKNVE